MGAKQSKRSVDISGKEAEGAGEVAAAGAGGEGRVEALADADALKPQLNGDAHIHESTDKEKLESGTTENEKDTNNEKQGKEQEESEKEDAPVTNGDSDQKAENGDSSPTTEDSKKPKKEKVKKKWSLRSISFSRKDKPKQEKKQKDDEPKTNGEPEKVPEEVAETTPETEINEVAEEAKPETEVKEEKTPETPVTEPITNGSSTPETPKVETPAVDEPAKESPENNRPDVKIETEPEHLPVNGLSLDEPKTEAPEAEPNEPSKPEETTVELPETVPASEIPVKKEVCVDQMPLIEPTPPPLPANPPPSSVASFAATTMAPELTDTSLAKTADNTIDTAPITTTNAITKPDDSIENNLNEIQCIPTLQASVEIVPSDIIDKAKDPENIEMESNEQINKNIEVVTTNDEQCTLRMEDDLAAKEETKFTNGIVTENPIEIPNVTTSAVEISNEHPAPEVDIIDSEVTSDKEGLQHDTNTTANITDDISVEPVGVTCEQERGNTPSPLPSVVDEDVTEMTTQNDVEEIVTEVHDSSELILESPTIVINSDHIDSNSIKSNDDTEMENLKNKTKASTENIASTEYNGEMEESKAITNGETTPPVVCATEEVDGEVGKGATTPEDSMPPSLSEANEVLAQGDGSESLPPPPSELCRSESEASPPASPEPSDIPQEALKTDIIADLIPEVPVVPDLNTAMESSSDVAVAN